ncbi:hypothetical protein B0T26DRAFT_675615 [Lasiosphaeria miniovina]|uniref:Uncharacterized protein n=1 Tax=Lasiosphaeria miniovina TaxID=1954250 RepID=A0AA40AK74_9PEZI|nr:uncharacterized protein B0T26DRAFT_675615 [Lasiosphaeria miniovina]KAK0717285.1 hypothetical protein B0T26DRAFT_675615 [Lasiosphaeria miniovina]
MWPPAATRLGAFCGHLSENAQLDAVLQLLFVFGLAVWLLLGAPIRIFQLYGAKLVVLPNRRGYFKIAGTVTLFALQLASLVFGILNHAHWGLLASRVLSFVAAFAVCVLSFLEHGRNVVPSTLLTIYFAGLLYVAWNLCHPWGLPSVIFAARALVLVLEGPVKTDILREPYDKLSPEETAGFFGVVFWWVNKILKKG